MSDKFVSLGDYHWNTRHIKSVSLEEKILRVQLTEFLTDTVELVDAASVEAAKQFIASLYATNTFVNPLVGYQMTNAGELASGFSLAQGDTNGSL